MTTGGVLTLPEFLEGEDTKSWLNAMKCVQ